MVFSSWVYRHAETRHAISSARVRPQPNNGQFQGAHVSVVTLGQERPVWWSRAYDVSVSSQHTDSDEAIGFTRTLHSLPTSIQGLCNQLLVLETLRRLQFGTC